MPKRYHKIKNIVSMGISVSVGNDSHRYAKAYGYLQKKIDGINKELRPMDDDQYYSYIDNALESPEEETIPGVISNPIHHIDGYFYDSKSSVNYKKPKEKHKEIKKGDKVLLRKDHGSFEWFHSCCDDCDQSMNKQGTAIEIGVTHVLIKYDDGVLRSYLKDQLIVSNINKKLTFKDFMKE